MIRCAAIKFHITSTHRDVILCGVRHGDCYSQLEDLGFKPKNGYQEIEQGFVTNNGLFLNRVDAYNYACECGQIPSTVKQYKHNIEESELYSEDLW